MVTRLMTTMCFIFRHHKGENGLLSNENLRKDEIPRFSKILSQKIDWSSMTKIGKKWIKNPLNMAVLLWIICVGVSGAILFLVMTGMLNNVLPNKSQRNAWFEINNQILNALFTLMSLYHHPRRIQHLVLLLRWNPKDISFLRKTYSKNGTYKPRERAHIMVVVMLLHLNCFAQYALCALNLGYKRSSRPAAGVGICLSVAIAAPAVAAVYCIVSPLGKEYYEVDSEAQNHIQRTFSFANASIADYAPRWKGGLFEFQDDQIATSYQSLFCSFCVFGWNMERLGFGNKYVHISTFILFCTAPFWILGLAAFHVDNEIAREAMVITGIVLCMLGLLYGGFWRIQMRKRFNLPANELCCGKPAITDCAQWLFCCWCSLAQEVRTAHFYEIREDKFCRKQMSDKPALLSPLPRENGISQYRFRQTSQLTGIEEDVTMKPPTQEKIHPKT